MNGLSFIFYALEGLAALASVGILFTRNVFYGTLLLIACLLAIAGIFVIVHAEFIAITQILVYAGGVVILIIFGVMLTSKIAGKPLLVKSQNWMAGGLVGLFFLGLLIKLFSETSFTTGDPTSVNTKLTEINQIGVLIMTDYILAFELAGILLLVALIGAAVVASSFTTAEKKIKL